MKILLVDDSRSIHSLLGEMLENSKISFQHAFNGKEAIAAIDLHSFDADLVLLDWEMPELTGIEALPEIRKRRPKLTIVMMTSKNSMSDIVEALQKGADDYLMKPFTKDILVGKINQIMKREVA